MKRLVYLLSGIALLTFVFQASSQGTVQNRPVVSTISVAHVAPGQSGVDATITGKNFRGVRKLDLGAGINVKTIRSVQATRIAFTFSVSVNASPGPRTITVVASSGTASKRGLLAVANTKPPNARFEMTPEKGKPGQSIRFDASRSFDPDGKIRSYVWSFDGRHRETGKIVRRQFRERGQHKVKLTVKDDKGVPDIARQVLTIVPRGSDNDQGNVCKGPVGRRDRHPDLYGRVISANRASKTLVVKLNTMETCSTAYYKCGDVKRGDGIRTPYEHWYGTICKMEYLGDSTFRIHLVKGHKFPSAGTTGVYLHWQPCAKPWCK